MAHIIIRPRSQIRSVLEEPTNRVHLSADELTSVDSILAKDSKDWTDEDIDTANAHVGHIGKRSGE